MSKTGDTINYFFKDAVQDYAESLDQACRDVLMNGTTVDYSGTSRTSNITSTDTLSVEDIKKAVESIKESDRKWREYQIERTSSPEWKKLYEENMKIIAWLIDKKTWKYGRLIIAYRVYYALSPSFFSPISTQTLNDYEKLRKEYYAKLEIQSI